MPFSSRICSFVKDNVDSPWLKLMLFGALTTLFMTVGLIFTAFEPVTNHGVPLSGIARCAFSVFIGCVLTAIGSLAGLLYYMTNEFLGAILKEIAKRL